ncbi:MAG: ATP-binding protein [Ignavibacteriae bacterium]|nr:ATP-binding protein [Ignavibacteriota bacterium]
MRNLLEKRLKNKDPELFASLKKCKREVSKYLQQYKSNFPTYTDHSIEHSKEVAQLASDILGIKYINKLHEDEIYILLMACYLHDIGMCIPKKQISKELKSERCANYKIDKSRFKVENYLRDVHHELSYEFIKKRWKELYIINEDYAEAIALVSKAHRVVDIGNFDEYELKFYVRSGVDYVCLPYLGCIIRLADELDITNIRVPDLLYKDFLPNNEKSREEWQKHKSTFGVNFSEDKIIIRGRTSDLNVFNTLLSMSNKIQKVLNNCLKVIKSITDNRHLDIPQRYVETDKIRPMGFIPLNIGFTFDVENVFKIFFGDKLYENKYESIREALQNSIDACRYKNGLGDIYEPKIEIIHTSKKITIKDNGIGMDEFIIRNYFSKLASSYYRSKTQFSSIGQFGIGVFSYFMISDYFEILTKKENNDAIKFRVNKNADSYFYFYDNSSLSSPGTVLTLYLNKISSKKLTFGDLYLLVSHFIRYCEIDIEIRGGNRTKLISKQSFEFENIEVLKRDNLEYKYKDKIDEVIFISIPILNEIVEGRVGLFIPVDEKGIFCPDKATEYFNYSTSVVNISQKGIFIKSISGSSFGLRAILGNINVKIDREISINRESFVGESIIDIETLFINTLLSKILRNWVSLTKKEKYKKINDFFRAYDLSRKIFLESNFKKEIIVKIFNNGRFKFMSLEKALENESLIIFVYNTKQIFFESLIKEIDIKSIISKLFRKYGLPILCIEGAEGLIIKSLMDKKIQILYDFGICYFIYGDYNEVENIRLHEDEQEYFKGYEFGFFESNVIGCIPSRIFIHNSTLIFNLNNEVIKTCHNILSSGKDKDTSELVIEILNTLSSLIRHSIGRYRKSELKEIEDLVSELSIKTNLSLKKEDLVLPLLIR